MGVSLSGVAQAQASLAGMSRRKRDQLQAAVKRSGQRQAQALRRSARAKKLGRVAREIKTSVRVSGDRITATTGIRRAPKPKKGQLDPAALGKASDVGTAERQTRKGAARGKMPAKDWITPAVRDTAEAIQNDLATAARA